MDVDMVTDALLSQSTSMVDVASSRALLPLPDLPRSDSYKYHEHDPASVWDWRSLDIAQCPDRME